MATKIIVKGCYTEAWAGCSSPYPRPWSSHGVMAGATQDLRLPSQPKSTATSHWPVLISCTAKGIGDLLEWLITYQDGVPVFFQEAKTLGAVGGQHLSGGATRMTALGLHLGAKRRMQYH